VAWTGAYTRRHARGRRARRGLLRRAPRGRRWHGNRVRGRVVATRERVAIKTLRAPSSDPVVERFQREAQLLSEQALQLRARWTEALDDAREALALLRPDDERWSLAAAAGAMAAMPLGADDDVRAFGESLRRSQPSPDNPRAAYHAFVGMTGLVPPGCARQADSFLEAVETALGPESSNRYALGWMSLARLPGSSGA